MQTANKDSADGNARHRTHVLLHLNAYGMYIIYVRVPIYYIYSVRMSEYVRSNGLHKPWLNIPARYNTDNAGICIKRHGRESRDIE